MRLRLLLRRRISEKSGLSLLQELSGGRKHLVCVMREREGM